jgi:hypothetical protein
MKQEMWNVQLSFVELSLNQSIGLLVIIVKAAVLVKLQTSFIEFDFYQIFQKSSAVVNVIG